MNAGSTRFGLSAFLSNARAGSRKLRLRWRSPIEASREPRARASSAAHPVTEGPDAGPASAAELTALRRELAHELERLAAESPRRGALPDAPSAGSSSSRPQLR